MSPLTHRMLSTVLTMVLGAAAALTVGTPAMASADPDVTAPVGRYQFDFTKIWDGQGVTLTALEVSDDVSAPADIRQYVDWGDGNFSYLDGDEKSQWHRYFNPGSYTVTVRVTDRAGNTSSGIITDTATITVVRTPGTFKIVKKEVFIGDPAVVTLAGIPSDVSQVRVWWGDGKESIVRRTAKQVTHHYTSATHWYVQVMLTNAAGETYGREIGTISTNYDELAPNIWLTKPKKPTYVSSWRTVNGTVKDWGRGTVAVGAAFIEQRGSSWYYYTGGKWVKAKSLNQALKKTRTITVRPTAKNTWRVKIKGLKKGTLYVFYTAVDKDGNQSEAKVKKQKLTR
jgi:5'-nucleotidase